MPEVIRNRRGLIEIVYREQTGHSYSHVKEGIRWGFDYPLPDKPPRPCARCGNEFQPTVWRRMLCEWCFLYGDGGGGPDE